MLVLYYRKTTNASQATYGLYGDFCSWNQSRDNACFISTFPGYWVTCFDGTSAELNNGAGGYNIWLRACDQSNSDYYPIKDIMVISASTSAISTTSWINANYPGWSCTSCDLNKGCGGKYIYLYVKR